MALQNRSTPPTASDGVNRWLAFATIGFLGILILIFFAVWLQPPKRTPLPTDTLPKIDRPTVTFVNPSLGPLEAKITMVAFGDFQCPSCRDMVQTLTTLQKTYPTEVRIVWKDMPNESMHSLATPAAIAAHCADRQKQFWPYAGALFTRQTFLTEDQFLQIARELNLNETNFKTCYDDRDTLPIVKKDYQEGLALDLTATPTVFVGDDRLVGAIDLEELISYVEQLRQSP